MYKVKRFFTDLQDNYYPYNEGDIFPREGVTVTEDRLNELSSSSNKLGIPLIEKVEETPKKAAKKANKKTVSE